MLIYIPYGPSRTKRSISHIAASRVLRLEITIKARIKRVHKFHADAERVLYNNDGSFLIKSMADNKF